MFKYSNEFDGKTGGHVPFDTQSCDATKSLRHLCSEAMEATGGLKEEAADLVIKKLRNNPDLYCELVGQIIHTAVWRVVGEIMRSDRNTFFGSLTEAGSDNISGLRSMAVKNMFDYPLIGGHKLGDASKVELAESIQHHEMYAKANKQKAVWLISIKKLIGDKIVRDAVTEEQIASLAEEAGIAV